MAQVIYCIQNPSYARRPWDKMYVCRLQLEGETEASFALGNNEKEAVTGTWDEMEALRQELDKEKDFNYIWRGLVIKPFNS